MHAQMVRLHTRLHICRNEHAKGKILKYKLFAFGMVTRASLLGGWEAEGGGGVYSTTETTSV